MFERAAHQYQVDRITRAWTDLFPDARPLFTARDSSSQLIIHHNTRAVVYDVAATIKNLNKTQQYNYKNSFLLHFTMYRESRSVIYQLKSYLARNININRILVHIHLYTLNHVNGTQVLFSQGL